MASSRITTPAAGVAPLIIASWTLPPCNCMAPISPVTLPSAPRDQTPREAGLPVVWVTITGLAPRTKKTSNRIVLTGNRRRILPSKAWADWCAGATIAVTWLRHGKDFVNWPVSCRALFFRDAERGDAVGYYQGLADLLEKRRIIANDSLIRDWDGSRLLKDAKNPRVEIVLRPVEG